MNSGQIVNGSCLCRKVGYQITGNMGVFQYCHCSRCRKFTGSAHAANLFAAPGDFSWIRGEELVGRYDPADTKYFATCFCKNCGSSLPWLSKSNNGVVIPARWSCEYCGAPLWIHDVAFSMELEKPHERAQR